jgi:hypothetical protein
VEHPCFNSPLKHPRAQMANAEKTRQTLLWLWQHPAKSVATAADFRVAGNTTRAGILAMMVSMQGIGWRLAAGILALCLSPAIAQDRDWNCPPTPGLPEGRRQWEKWFVGSIGSVGARMHLIGGGEIAKGEFYRQNDWKPVIVGGRVQADGTLLLHDEQESNCGVKDECAGPGMLRARLTKASLTGTWKGSPGDQTKAIQMRVEPVPKCGVGGPKRVFRDPAWPITFEFPAAWHVDATADAISLLCPDPDWMAYEGRNISLTLGNLAPSGDLPTEAILSEFIRNEKGKWQYESSLGGGPNPAVVGQRDGMTIIRAEDAARRGYCLVGGYSGLTDEELVLIILDGHWILVNGGPQATEIVKLVVNGAAPRK